MFALHKRRIKRKPRTSKEFIIALTLIVLAICIALTASLMSNRGASQAKPKAVIIDGLLHYPNETFVKEATSLLNSTGFEVDYIGGEKVTVDLYRRLPSLGYRIIILRVHCGPLVETLPNGTIVPGEDAILFTAEAYSPNKYRIYQRGQLARAVITGRPNELYFAVPPWFFDECAEGRFDDSIVILDSCYGFYSTSMAEAFIRRGAKVFIGWDGEVQAKHTDYAVLVLLKYLLIDRLTVDQAVRKVMDEVGPDPYHHSVMLFYPSSAGDYRLERLKR